MASDPKIPKYYDGIKPEHRHLVSKQSISKKLSLHTSKPVQVAIRAIITEEISSSNPVQNANFLTFHARSHGDQLLYPSDCYHKLEIKVVKKTGGGDLLTTDNVLLASNTSSTMMKNCDLKVNKKVMQSGDGLYAYRADLEKRLNFTSEGRKNLDICDFEEEEYGKFEDLSSKITWTSDISENPIEVRRFMKRSNKIKNGKIQYLYDLIHGDIFNQTKPLPPNSEFELTFDKQDNPDFYILSRTSIDAGKYVVQIVRSSLILTYIVLDQEILNQILSVTIDDRINYHYPIRRIEMNYYNKPTGVADFSETNTIIKEGNVIPRRMFIVLVKQSSFQGNVEKDPFNYINLRPTNIALRCGGQLLPYPEIKTNRNQNEDDIREPLLYLRKSVGLNFSQYFSLGISEDRYREGGCFIIGYDLTSGDSEDVYEMVQRKTVDLNYILLNTVAEPYVMIVMTEFDAEMTIDEYGNVTKVNNAE